MFRLILPAILFFGLALSVSSADLTKVPRTIGKEPAYRTKPEYALLVFGPEAKTRMWMVLDGSDLYVDRKLNNDLTDSENFITSEGSRTFNISGYRGNEERTFQSMRFVSGHRPNMWVTLAGPDKLVQLLGRNEVAPMTFGSSPATAPVLHLNGPMQFAVFEKERTFYRDFVPESVRSASLRLMLGTPGLGEGTFAAYHCKCRLDKGGLSGEVEFPARNANDLPLKQTVAWQSLG